MAEMSIKRLKAKAKLLYPIIRIGKAGLTPSQINEINKSLKKKRLIKIKFLRPFIEDGSKKSKAEEIAEKTGAVLVEQIGNVVVLYKD